MTIGIVINENDGKTRNVMTGGETTVDFDFPIFFDTDIRLIETDTNGVITELVKDTDFTVPSGSVNVEAGGALNLTGASYPSGATAGHVFTALLATDYARVTDFNQAGDFFADTLNLELDLITQQIQQINREQGITPKLPEDTTIASVTLASPEDGKLIAWDGALGAMKNVTVSSLGSLTVSETSLSTGQALFYNSVSGAYENAFVDTANISDDAITLAKLEDGTQGDILYYGASGAPTRLSAGTDGQVLTTGGAGANPAWEDAAPSGWVPLQTQTVSSPVASVDFTSNIDSTYKAYAIVITGMQAVTGSQYPSIRLGNGGSFDSTSGDYAYSTQGLSGASGENFNDSTDSTLIRMSGTLDTGTGGLMNAVVMINDPSAAEYTYVSATGGQQKSAGVITVFNLCGAREEQAAHDRIQFLMSSGNIDAGTFTLYGIAGA